MTIPPKKRTTTLRPFTEIPARRLRFVWSGRIVAGGVSAIVGIGGRGKSQLSVRLGADLTNGVLPGDFKGKRVAVVIASAEDPSEQVIRPRLEAAGANLEHVFELRMKGGDNNTGELLNLPGDIDAIGDAVRTLRTDGGFEEVVVFIDPFKAHLTLAANTNQEHHMRHVLAALQMMAHATDCAVVLIDHPNKKSEAVDMASRMSGAGTYNAIRAAMVFGKDPDSPDGDTRLIAVAKSNWAEFPPALRVQLVPFTVADDMGEVIRTVRLEWDGEASNVTYEDILEAEGVKAGEQGRKWSKTAACEFYIRGRLRGTPGLVPAEDILNECMAQVDCARRTAQRASRALEEGRYLFKEKSNGAWYWRLGEAEEPGDAF